MRSNIINSTAFTNSLKGLLVFVIALFIIPQSVSAQNCMTLSMTTRGTAPEFAAHGAGDLMTYYPGISATKGFKVCATGGVEPYNAVWSVSPDLWKTVDGSSGLTQFGNAKYSTCYVNNGKAGVIYPYGPFTISVTVTDANGCVETASMSIGYVDYTCNPPGEVWHIQFCETSTQSVVCVERTDSAQSKLGTGLYELGTCGTKTGLDATAVAFAIYPNPVAGLATIRYNAIENASAFINIVDLNGRVVNSVEVELNKGNVEYGLDLSFIPNGVYFIQLITPRDVVTQKIQVLK